MKAKPTSRACGSMMPRKAPAAPARGTSEESHRLAGSELARHGLRPHDQPARSRGVHMKFAHMMAALPLLFAGGPVLAQAPARAEAVDTRRMSEMTRVLASDAFEGRSMGTAG